MTATGEHCGPFWGFGKAGCSGYPRSKASEDSSGNEGNEIDWGGKLTSIFQQQEDWATLDSSSKHSQEAASAIVQAVWPRLGRDLRRC